MLTDEIYLYRIVHIENIPHILTNGITKKDSTNANQNFKSIGDLSLIDTRSSKMVSVDNGDLTLANPKQICLGDFIPFYFGIRMPMLYVMQNGGNFVEQATPPQKIVYLACSLNKILETGSVYYFSDGHGTDNLTSFFDKDKVSELAEIVDWSCIKATFWGGNENLDVKRKKQAEFLVASDIPSNCVTRIVCYNEAAKQALMGMGVPDEKIKIMPGAYY